MALKDKGLEAISFTGSQAGIITDDYHTEARIIKITAERVKTAIDSGKIAIVAGFQGVSKNREITTLGRGGSDTSAIALACSLGAEYCDIFTDVDGVYSINPGLIKSKLIERIDYLEMMEMALLGADVLHPRAVEIASRYDLPIRVRSIFKEYECFKKTRS
ncbi:aspartate kinase, partial [Candidatus Methanophagaceae archaeon]